MANFKFNKLFLQKNTITKKEFNYTKGDCRLSFVLTVDNKRELKNFRECLVEAEKDIDKLLNN